MSKASSASGVVRRSLSAQPTTGREKRSRMTAKYSQPSPVVMKVMSVTQQRLGVALVNCRLSHIPRDGQAVRRVRRGAKRAPAAGGHAGAAHETGHAVATDAVAAGAQLGVDP